MKTQYSLRTIPLFFSVFALCALLLNGSTPAFAQHQSPSNISGLKTQAGPYSIAVVTDPPVVPVGRVMLRITVKDAAGKPVEGATVRALVGMPNMKMGERVEVAQPQAGAPGVYVAPANFPHGGQYVGTITIDGPAGAGSGTITLSPGQNTAVGSGNNLLSRLLIGAGVLGLLAFIVFRMRRSGQELHVRGLFTPPVLGGIAVLAAMLALVVYAVNNWRRPGAMTPLEAQGMDMTMPAPPGTLAVELAPVQRGPVQSRVRYSGQAVGYIEQDVYSRVSGNLLWMPFYTGSRVRRGQLLARLDTSQIEPQIAQQRAAQSMAEQNAISAQGNYRQAVADVSRARAELAGRRGALAEAIAGERKARAEIGVRLGQLAEARSGERKARSTAGGRRGAVSEARSGEQRAQAVLREATTGLRAARGAATEAQSDLAAAREDRSNSEADLEAARTQVSDAQAGLQAAQADQEYWTQEIERMRVLLKEGAVSREEFQREQAQAENAAAKVRQAQARINQVQAGVRGAESRIRRADAMIRSAEAKVEQAEAAAAGSGARIEQAQADIVAAGARIRQAQAESEGAGADISGASARIRQMEEDVKAARAEASSAAARVQQMRAEIEAAESGIRGAQAQAAAASGGIGQAQAGVAQARAAVASTTTTRGYAAIRALVDGVVTQRTISPGTFVQPGQPILKVAQLDPIRLQANVAEDDLKRVRIGSSVTVRVQNGAHKGHTVSARVTSVSPAVDPQTRTGLVEAIVPNKEERFKPGEFIVMEIETGQSVRNLLVPSSAIQRRAAPDGSPITTNTQTYVWVAEPDSAHPGQYKVSEVNVQTGVSDGSKTEVLSGLREGQQVVTVGYQSLHDGDTVTIGDTLVASNKTSAPVNTVQGQNTHRSTPEVQTASVTVTEKGFEPPSVPLRRGIPARVTFTRKTEATCATDVVFPDFKIKKALPINKPVVVEFTPEKNGEIIFGCGMDLMLSGKVVTR